jgi:anthranilate synthase/aminodeoxychorismate synthase-like glutamine amidotransferase
MGNCVQVLLVIDNYDSFTFNLVQYFGQLGVEQRVFRNNEITPDQAVALNPDRVLISPGPCSPAEAGVSLDMIKAFAGKKPIFGVCLGHQSIGHYFGGKVVRADRLMHGKTSPILHKDTDLFRGLPQGFAATRYHSLLVERASLPSCLAITAETANSVYSVLPSGPSSTFTQSFAVSPSLSIKRLGPVRRSTKRL